MAPVAYAAFVVCLVLYPFDFYPPNGVEWLIDEPGIRFGGGGIAYTDAGLSELVGSPLEEMTVELWLREPKVSENWGLRAIFSVRQRGSGPSLFFGQWRGRFLLYSPDAEWVDPWYEQFILEERVSRGEDHFVAITIGRGGWAIFLDDRVVDKRRMSWRHRRALDVSGPLVLGAGAGGRGRWWGDMKGLAIYRRVLSAEQIESHRNQARRAGIRSLATAGDLIALFPFDERAGQYARNLVRGSPDIHIPARFSSLPEGFFDFRSFSYLVFLGRLGDMSRNTLFFLPLGWLLAACAMRNPDHHRGVVAIGVILAGGSLSFALEAIQSLVPDRDSSVVDVAANSLGTAIGVLAWFASRCLRRAP